MKLSTVMEVATQLLFGKGVIGSDRLEYLLPHHDGVVHYAEFCGVPHKSDEKTGNLYDVFLLHGRRGNNFTGLWNADVVKRDVGFHSLVQTFETIGQGFRDPDTGRILISRQPLVKNADAIFTNDGTGLRLTTGSQKHYKNCWDYDVYAVRQQKRQQKRQQGEDPDIWL